MTNVSYDLWYWTGLQGRGEFVRLAFEAAEIPYNDCARERGDDAMIARMTAIGTRQPFAPPFLEVDGFAIAQVANILLFLGERHGLAPTTLKDRYWLHQVQLTISDVVAEVHNVHHPVDGMAYYDEQKPEAARAAKQFRKARMPKFLGWFEDALDHGRDWLVGDRWSPGDTSLFQLVAGLRYMFPMRMAALEPDYPKLIALYDRVADLPGIRAYLASDRRIAFNETGIFRHYPELDAE